ncbi:DUF1592 domain-containing protein [Sandaracinus amylolyticus]|uniref:DUF1592 domain-containing protein n=1 Tax=Sandaracinus amylolyticus TaxID=927083 RepID=UPI001F16267C|nr:DUF1592 domain-containing protein [Sandaracinus amylolyticus]UJR86198.1 Hypothetical protein I5071_82800 [Sandaracinus amylolyticus]
MHLGAVAAVAASVLGLSACTGVLGSSAAGPGDGSGGGGGAPSDGPPPLSGTCNPRTPVIAAPMRRLTEAQWRATVDALFDGRVEVPDGYPDPLVVRGYRTYGALGTPSPEIAAVVADLALEIAESATADLSALLGCTPGDAPDDACAAGFVESFLTRAQRRTPTADERATMLALYGDLRGDGYSPREGVAAVIEAVLQAPAFLYVSERGASDATAPGTVVALGDHEIAQRLSFFLWDAPPDAELTRLADEGTLHEPATLEAQARRMVADPRVASVLGRFVEDWLELQRLERAAKSDDEFPDWRSVSASIAAEAARFTEEVVLRRDARLETLLSASFTVGDAGLAKLYGVAAPANGGWGVLELDPSERRGVLTQAGFLASHSGATEPAPVVRGATILRNVLCLPMELPPGLMVTSPAPDPTRTTRERFEEHRADPACAGCHDRIDPIGFGLEGFDAIGGFRTTEPSGLPIDTSGVLLGAGDGADGAFVGGAELAERLSQSDAVRDCVARQVYQYAQARVAAGGDECVLERVTERFAASDGDLRELLVAIATSDPFLSRTLPE